MKKHWEDGPRIVSVGRTFKYRRLLAQPTELLYSKAENRVILRMTPLGCDPRCVSSLDVLVAELSALAATRGYWRLRLTRARLDVYLAFPGPIQVAVDVDLQGVRAMVDDYLSHAGAELPPAVPASALAYCMLMRQSNLSPTEEVGAHQFEKILASDQEPVSQPSAADHYYRPAANLK